MPAYKGKAGGNLMNLGCARWPADPRRGRRKVKACRRYGGRGLARRSAKVMVGVRD